jgi:hypothetical protein
MQTLVTERLVLRQAYRRLQPDSERQCGRGGGPDLAYRLLEAGIRHGAGPASKLSDKEYGDEYLYAFLKREWYAGEKTGGLYQQNHSEKARRNAEKGPDL